jgi:hypothetical protein
MEKSRTEQTRVHEKTGGRFCKTGSTTDIRNVG